MKKKGLSFNYITLTLICQFCLCCGMFFAPSASAKNVNDFYFDNYEADYYLTKDSDGLSKMKVVEEFAAVFPDFNQNKGICRQIPFSSKGGKNMTLKSLTKNDIKLTRNGLPEPIYSIEKEDDYYEVCTGTEEYVTGLQVYVFEYSFENVVTEFSESGKEWQELYWNTNGTGWKQRFNKVTARVHFENPTDMTGKKWCYVGKTGENNQSRCAIEKTEDGFEFTVLNLASGENLTFDIELKPGIYKVEGPEKNYSMIFAAIIAVGICALLLKNPIRKFKETRENREFYKNYFIKPEYAPHKDYSLVEMSAVYIGKQKDFKVALLLQMIVKGKIELIKSGKTLLGKQKWSIHIKSPVKDMEDPEKYILEILKGSRGLKDDDSFEIKRRSGNSELASIGRLLSKAGETEAKSDGLITKSLIPTLGIGTFFIFMGFVWALPVALMFLGEIENGSLYGVGEEYVGALPSLIVAITSFIITVIIRAILKSKSEKFAKRTKAGLEASRYMDGLKLYIEMAEKDRLAFLQSVKGADTSDAGIVKLYEKLLPYAALFGVEESWMKELEKYYDVANVETPEWYSGHSEIIRAASFASIIRDTSNIVSSTSYSSSSSGSSGGGGGGFSGGGGGGGGGGGR